MEGKEVLQTYVGWGKERKVWAERGQSLSFSGHAGCQQTSSVIYNRTPLTKLCKVLFMFVCELFRTLAAVSDRDITQAKGRVHGLCY